MELLLGDNDADDGMPEPLTPSSPQPAVADTHGGGAAVAMLTEPAAVVTSLFRPETFAISIPMLVGLEPQQSTSACDPAWLKTICDADAATQIAWLAQLCSDAEMMSPKERSQLRLAAEQCRRRLGDRDWARHASLWMIVRASEPNPPEASSAFVPPHEVAGYSRIILSVLAVCDGDDGMADYEFMRGWSQLRFADTSRLPAAELSWDEFESAVQRMSQAPPSSIESLLVAIANVVSGDGRVSESESAIIAMIRTALES